MIQVQGDKRTREVIEALSKIDKARVNRTVQFFQDKGFLLDTRYLKKITKGIWELRAGRVRLLFGMVGSNAMVVNVFVKKTQKTPLKEIMLAERRLGEY